MNRDEKLGKFSKTRVMLVNPPLLEDNAHHPLFPPLGLTYLAAVLKQDNHEIKIIDCPIDNLNHKKLSKELANFEPKLIGITSMTPTIKSAIIAAQNAKEVCPESTVIFGGPHVTFMDQQILKEENAVDIVVRGEGELTLQELAQNEIIPKNLQKIKGITFRKDNKIIRTVERPYIQNLDELPLPAYEYVPLEKYRIHGKIHLPIMTSRGCPFQCSFCVASEIFGARFRARSCKNVVDELEWLKDEHGANAISFQDDTLTFDRKRILDICAEIEKRKINLPWGCQTRVDQVTKEVLSKMKKASCNLVSFGIESGCQEILDAVKKKITISQAQKSIKWAKDEGLFVAVSTIMGYPGETKEMMHQTLKFIRRIEPDDAWLCIATPYPGTDLRRLVEKKGWKMSDNWTQYDTMHPVFENPNLPSKELAEMRTKFYNNLYSPKYIFRQIVKGYLKGNYYSQLMAKTAVGYMIWRIRSKF
jgi:radical SAM superfamily enzyme YgiQ (UPF0313 family)